MAGKATWSELPRKAPGPNDRDAFWKALFTTTRFHRVRRRKSSRASWRLCKSPKADAVSCLRRREPSGAQGQLQPRPLRLIQMNDGLFRDDRKLPPLPLKLVLAINGLHRVDVSNICWLIESRNFVKFL